MSNFRKLNESSLRIPLSSSERFSSSLLPARQYNQYTRPSALEVENDSYRYLVMKSNEVNGCWLLSSSTGIDINKGGYARFSHNGEKICAHVYVYLYHHPGESVQDISHLCNTRNCINPLHLVSESHDENMSRISCPGTVIPWNTGGYVITLCKHNPKCLKRHYYDPNTDMELM